jgi:hypothetical protein
MSDTQTQPRGRLETSFACLLAWLVPGAGHLYLGRRAKGLILGACLLALFVLGIAMDARLQSYAGLEDPLALLRSAAQMALGLPYFIARGLGLDSGRVTSVVHEYGNTFTEVAGLLNVLVILDTYDTAVGRRR